jgi:DnaD/phage-associated family protein
MSKDTSKLLIDEHPLQVLPTLACKVGLNGAIILQQVHYWLGIAKKAKDDRKFKDGQWWVYNTYEEWQENFPWWSLPTIKRTILRLEADSLLISREMDAQDWDHTKWYTINYATLNGLIDCIKVIPSEESDRGNGTPQDDPLLIESETTTETTTKNREIEVNEDTEIFTFLSGLTGGGLNSETTRYVDTWKEKHTLFWVLKAIGIAAEKGARSVKYVDAILVGWEANGYPKSREERVKEKRNGNRPPREADKQAGGGTYEFCAECGAIPCQCEAMPAMEEG